MPDGNDGLAESERDDGECASARMVSCHEQLPRVRSEGERLALAGDFASEKLERSCGSGDGRCAADHLDGHARSQTLEGAPAWPHVVVAVEALRKVHKRVLRVHERASLDECEREVPTAKLVGGGWRCGSDDISDLALEVLISEDPGQRGSISLAVRCKRDSIRSASVAPEQRWFLGVHGQGKRRAIAQGSILIVVVRALCTRRVNN
mmetsp:Transcript_953/g.2267  ORF Transcript_953/g.2267 Transcript_953/m.2267 type:complete len:207 (+) Transcript_953:407-1027(+)